jgi:hypothetical protein
MKEDQPDNSKPKLTEAEIIQKYKDDAGNRKRDKGLLTKIKKKVEALKKDDSNVYPLY